MDRPTMRRPPACSIGSRAAKRWRGRGRPWTWAPSRSDRPGRRRARPSDPAVWPGLNQSPPLRPWLAPALGETAWAEVFPRSTRPARLALAAGLLQIHDFWDASHEAAQQADDLGERGSSAYWHGIAHRREPDAGNAAYWFRRVGRHPIFGRLAEDPRVRFWTSMATSADDSLLAAGAWNPFALLISARPPVPARTAPTALQLQRAEMGVLLLEATAKAL